GGVAAATSEDGRRLAVVHVGRVGVMDTSHWQEKVFTFPSGAGEAAQPPAWVSGTQLALTLGTRDAKGRHYAVWLLNTTTGQFTRLCDGYLLPWTHRPDAIAASPGMLHLTYTP
ncbi:MAG: hypothetical protein ACYCW6_27140, partial [Candidatus Xenobia bacterium]